jgi:Flp pilus assembly pilin Flp
VFVVQHPPCDAPDQSDIPIEESPAGLGAAFDALPDQDVLFQGVSPAVALYRQPAGACVTTLFFSNELATILHVDTARDLVGWIPLTPTLYRCKLESEDVWMVIGSVISLRAGSTGDCRVGMRARDARRRGAGILEYTLLIAFFTGLVIATLGFFGQTTANTLDNVASNIAAADSQAQSGDEDSGEIAEDEGHGGGVGASGDHGNNGVGNGEDGAPPGNAPENDGAGTGPGNPGARGGWGH